MSKPPAQFDRDIPLTELLRAFPGNKLEAALTKTLGPHWFIADDDGATVLGPGTDAAATAIAVPLHVDIEIVGHLFASGTGRSGLEPAAAWIEMLLASAHRYLMVADLHVEAVNADYEALQRQHAALQESEARYRTLAAELEQRVKQQVTVIERAQRQLYQSEKMASVGSLAAGMAHEINNPIGFIRSNLSTAVAYVGQLGTVLNVCRRGDVKETEASWSKLDVDFVLQDFAGLLAESVAGADRITRIVANLKAYASVDCAEAAEADLNDAVRAVTGILQDQLPENIALEVDLHPLPNIVCDQGRINQVLFSLVQNARQSLGDKGGRIRVASRVNGDEIRIAVSDNGCGIAPNVLSRIFDPFFTTRDVGKGVGLGLTVSRDIVTAHRGRIEIQSAVGSGSVFTVCIPLDTGIAKASYPESAA